MVCYIYVNQFGSVQSLSRVQLFVTPWIGARQASLSITNSWSPPKPMSIKSMMPSNHLILCHPLLLLPSIFPSIRVFSNEPVRMAAIKKSANNKCWRGCGEKRTLLHCWWECKLIHPLWRMVWRFLKKLGIKLPYDPAIPLLGIYPEETGLKKTCVSHCSLQHYLQ